jgi:class 3 adenylate cyclase
VLAAPTGNAFRTYGAPPGPTRWIGARVSALAEPNDVPVSSTLRDLGIGSELKFEERGTHELKGTLGEWRLSAVASP